MRGRGEWMALCFNARSSQSMGAARRSDILTEKHSATILQEDWRRWRMVTQDVRLDLIQHEYTGMRNAVHTLMDRMDGYEAAVLGLTEAVSQNSDRISGLEDRTDRVEQRLDRVEQRLDVIEDKLDAIIKHLKVPYKRLPVSSRIDAAGKRRGGGEFYSPQRHRGHRVLML